MERRFVYRNADGVRRTMVTDEETPGVVKTFTEVRMDEVLESINRAREVEAADRFATNRVLARVPMTIYERSLLEQWDEDQWKSWLNDPANSAFRVWPGRV